MTSHIQIPKPVVVEKQMSEVKAVGMKAMVGKRSTKTVKFMGEELSISKLSMEQVLAVQEAAKKAEAAKDDNTSLDLIKNVIRDAVEGAADLTDAEFRQFPFDDLNLLSQDILKFSGLGNGDPK